MKYQEKLKLAEKGIEFLSRGKTTEDYEKELLNDGYDKFDISKVVSSIKNLLNEKYGKEFKALLLEEKLEENRKNYPMLDDETFKRIKEKQTQSIMSDIKKEVRDMVYDDIAPEIIAEKVSNKYFSSSRVISYIKKYKMENDIVSSKGKYTYIFLGILITAATLIVMLVSGRLYYFVLIAGIILLIKGISAENRTGK